MSDPVETTDRAHDRLALRQLVEAYAHAADRRKSELSGSLFTADGLLAIYDGDPEGREPNRTRRGPAGDRGRDGVAGALLGDDPHPGPANRRVRPRRPPPATGETYCLAHHVTETDEGRRMYIMSIRYLDQYRRVDGLWKFDERRLAVDWTDDRLLGNPAASDRPSTCR